MIVSGRKLACVSYSSTVKTGRNSGPCLYVGLTSDVNARLADHNAGRCSHTAAHRPWHLHVVIEFAEESTAICFERYLKSGSGSGFAKRHFELRDEGPSTSRP